MGDTEKGAKPKNKYDLNMIEEYFSIIERQNPGGDEQTVMALDMIGKILTGKKIADIGCGTGATTRLIQECTGAEITAVDIFPQFIKKLKKIAEEEKTNISDYNKKNSSNALILTLIADMKELPFTNKEFDVIWSEGAIFNIGFKRGLTTWKKFLKDDGYIAVSELSWLTEERPKEIEDYWNLAYPEMDTIYHKLQQMNEIGYTPIGSFLLPEECWTENYYVPQHQAQERLLDKYPNHSLVTEFVNARRREEELYQQYKSYFGYVFYIGKKKGTPQEITVETKKRIVKNLSKVNTKTVFTQLVRGFVTMMA